MSRCPRPLASAVTLAATGLTVVALAGPAHAASLRVSATSGLAPGGQTVTVTGSGFDPARNNGFGVYVVFGPRKANFHQNANAFASAVWVHPKGSGGGQARMSPSGAFSVSLSVKAAYKDGDGRSVDCAKTPCYVMAFAAHGVPDRSQDAFVPISFRGSATGGGSGGTTSGTPSGPTTAGMGGAPNPATTGGPATGPATGPTTGADTASPLTAPAGAAAATPVAVEPFRETATDSPARSPWPFWLAVGAVAVAALVVRRIAARPRR